MYGCLTESLPTHSIVSLARIKKTKYARQDAANKTKIKFLREGLTWAVALPQNITLAKMLRRQNWALSVKMLPITGRVALMLVDLRVLFLLRAGGLKATTNKSIFRFLVGSVSTTSS